eukprot:Mycagemm_TRINITY_DN3280_c0_g1::TRINITY_DN3280_c0_g1_i1::g.4407::m.4407 type:complete len:233 gc:universal TRINITY_DN3280_c0_g1_i1:45-743(+)
MSTAIHSRWLFLYYKQHYRSSRLGYFTFSTFLAVAALIAVSLIPSEPPRDASFARVATFLGSIAFATFLLAALAFLYSSVDDELVMAALAYERELEEKSVGNHALGGSWHRSVHCKDTYARRSVQFDTTLPTATLHEEWCRRTNDELYHKRMKAFILAIVGRAFMLLGILLLLAALVCIAQFKIGADKDGAGLSIALTVVLSLLGMLTAILAVYQDFWTEIWAPELAPVKKV